MCGGQDVTTTAKTELDPAIRGQMAGNINLANQIAAGQNPAGIGGYPAYMGPRIAGLSAPTLAAMQAIPHALGQTTPYFTNARERLGQQTTASGVNDWLNPMMGQVEEGIRRNADIQRTQRGAQAAAAKAFGGSRQAVMESAADEGVNRAIGDARAGGWNNAAQQYLSSQQQNQGAAQALAQLGIQQRQQSGQDIATLLGLGDMLQGREQQRLDLGYNEYQNALNWPLRQLGIRQSALSGIPMPTTQTQTGPGPNPVAGGLGALLALAGIGGPGGFGVWGKGS